MDNFIYAVTLIAAVACGMIAGVFFAFSTFVMKALARLPAHEGIVAMQSINIAAVKSGFLGSFLGTAASRWMSYQTNWTAWNHVRTLSSLAATTLLILAADRL